MERGEEDATIEIELESYEKDKYSWFSKSPFKSKILNNTNNNSNNTLTSNTFNNISNNIDTFNNGNTIFNLSGLKNNNIENKSFLEIVEDKNSSSQKEYGLDILSDNNLLKSDIKLEAISPLKLEGNFTESKLFVNRDIDKKINSNINTSFEINNKSESSTRVKSILEKYKFNFDHEEDRSSSNLNKPFSLNKDQENKLFNDKLNSKNDNSRSSFITSEINKIHDDITKTLNETNKSINTEVKISKTPVSNVSRNKSLDSSLESTGKIHQSPKSFLNNNLNDIMINKNNNDTNDKLGTENKSSLLSLDTSLSPIEKKETKTNDKRSSLGSLNLSHFNLSSKNEDISKRIEEIRERLKLNESRQEKSKDNIQKDSSIFHFEAKSERKSTLQDMKTKLKDYELHKISNNESNEENFSDGTNELINSSSFEQLEISSKDEKRQISKKKPFSLDSLKNISSDSFSLNLNLSSNSTTSISNSSQYPSKRSSIPTFSQFYSFNKSLKESKKSKSVSLNIPKSQSPTPTIEQQLANPSSTFRVAKYARINNTKLPMPSKVPRKLYDEFLNSRGDISSNPNSTSEIKPVEPRKQAIPISKLRQPSKLRLRPNILNSSQQSNSSTGSN
ncbi:hypothetical protein BCR36DRAFT_354075 [Piromyces finnis]|uniref:Uncharacterized protein n=1 Tax=Piromyces finnis TaxID=1754191 RepID=A0A1Y1V754_9FUNG|nr:hypothetical protein BCR36DRAFT_354075 [Piromyces finnis]|eukprot:ORX48956.1 hypothetical protein BCR36DRAFT_354075 [Piromyces finnis]